MSHRHRRKERHGCLSVLLWLLMLVQSLSLLVQVFYYQSLNHGLFHLAPWVQPVMLALIAFDLTCLIAIYFWKKWGFYGVVVSRLMSLIYYLIIALHWGNPHTLGLGLYQVAGLIVIYIALQMGGSNKGWDQLE